MTSKLYQNLTKMLSDKSANNKAIAKALLNNKHLNRTVKIARFCNVSLSAVNRFVKTMNYPSFKHFLYEYENDNYFQISDSEKLTINKYKEEAFRIAKKIKGQIFIATSRKDKCVGKFLNERLNDGFFRNELFHETQDRIDHFLKKVKKNTLILISFFDYSKIFNTFLQEVAKLKVKPNLIVITNAKWLDVFEKYNYISIEKINNKNYDIENWSDYNSFLKDVFILFFEIMNNLKRCAKN